MTGLLIPTTTVLNQIGFVLFIGVAIDTFIVRTLLVPAAVTAFTFEGSLFKSLWKGKNTVADPENGTAIKPYLNQEPDDNHIQSVWRYKDVDANWWPSMMPRVLLSSMGEHEALWAGYDCPLFYLRDMKGHSEYDDIVEDNYSDDIIIMKDVEVDCILAGENMEDLAKYDVADNEPCDTIVTIKTAEIDSL